MKNPHKIHIQVEGFYEVSLEMIGFKVTKSIKKMNQQFGGAQQQQVSMVELEAFRTLYFK